MKGSKVSGGSALSHNMSYAQPLIPIAASVKSGKLKPSSFVTCSTLLCGCFSSTVCPISRKLLTKHQINYTLSFRKLPLSCGRRISHALPAHRLQNLGGHLSLKTAQTKSAIPRPLAMSNPIKMDSLKRGILPASQRWFVKHKMQEKCAWKFLLFQVTFLPPGPKKTNLFSDLWLFRYSLATKIKPRCAGGSLMWIHAHCLCVTAIGRPVDSHCFARWLSLSDSVQRKV